MKKVAVVVVGVGLLVATVPVMAHHAWAAEYDPTKPVVLEGTVTSMDWVNPHSWLYVDVKGKDGKVVNWAIEGGSPSALLKRGVRKDSMPTGVKVTVKGWQAKNGKPVANGADVIFPDGTKLFMGSSGTGAPGDPGQ